MAGILFGVNVSAAACTDTAKSIVGVKAPANQGVIVRGLTYGFDGVTTTNPPGLIEVCMCTGATNWTPGTNNTEVTPLMLSNERSETLQSKGLSIWTSEPTVLTSAIKHLIPVLMGSAHIEFATPIVVGGGKGVVLRITLPSGVTANFTGGLICEE